MSAGKLVQLLCWYVNDELQTGRKLVQVMVPTAQEEQWTWCLLGFDQLANSEPIPLLPPIRLTKGELFGVFGCDTYYAALEDFNCSQVSKDSLVDPAVQDTMSEYVRNRLAQKGSSTPFLFLRLKPQLMPLDADAVASELRSLTWIRFRSLPPALAHRKVDIEIGAHRTYVKPALETPFVEFEIAEGYFAGYVLPGVGSGIKYNVCGKHGSIQTFTLTQDVFLNLIGFPIQEGYGYEYSLFLEFDALLKESDNVERTVQESLKHMSAVPRAQLFERVRAEVVTTRQTYMRRLDERKKSLQSRK